MSLQLLSEQTTVISEDMKEPRKDHKVLFEVTDWLHNIKALLEQIV